MLYPKKNLPLTQELFLHPTSEYRAAPFWAWNNKLDPTELKWQIEQLKLLGYGGFHMHVRTGMDTEYLSDEFMESIAACVEKARSENMLAWLYDEDRWPSGAAGGLVTKNPDYRIRYLRLTQTSLPETGNSREASDNRQSRKLLAYYDVRLAPNGDLGGYRLLEESGSVEAEGIKLYAYLESSPPEPWYNNQSYVNTLDPKAIQEFIRITYERYNNVVSKDFGGIVPAIFTDEPQFSRKQTLAFAYDNQEVILPWTDDLPETYAAAFAGENVLDSIPELLWDLPENKISRTRYRYHDHIAERFASAFADQCGDWCERHGLMLTGHMMEEPTLKSQTASLGEAMRSYRSFQLPGIDMLCDWREFTTAKQAQSAARQYGRPGVMSELYGVTNWDFDFRRHKLQGDWQAALGVTVRVPHLSWVSMNGEAKRDYPATFNYQAPWYKEYPYIEDHFARVNTALTRGKAIVHVGVIHPVESYWLHWGTTETTYAIREQMEQNFQNITSWLLFGLFDFDFICESLLPEQCEIGSISREGFPVGDMRYEVIIVPALETMRRTTLERLEAFRKQGGRLIFAGDCPDLVDATPTDKIQDLLAKSEHINFEKFAILAALNTVREIEIRGNTGAMTENLLYQLRQDKDCRWLFIAHGDCPADYDLPRRETLTIKIRGNYRIELYHSLNGEIRPLPAETRQGWTMLKVDFYEHDSLLLRLDECTEPQVSSHKEPVPCVLAGEPRFFLYPVPVTLHEPNVLLLDIAEYALDNSPYYPAEEVLRLDTKLRAELGWAPRQSHVVQPWVEKDTSTPHTLRLRFVFQSKVPVAGAYLALENSDITEVSLNGRQSPPPDGWYVDKCIGKVALSDIRAGENVIELKLPYGKKIDVESCYLLGDFGVEVRGRICVLTEKITELAFGDITRQGLPFYGGNITYHLHTSAVEGCAHLAVSCYRGHLLRVAVDSEDKGVIAFSPYISQLGKLASGKHIIDVTYFGSRVNTFGQLHSNNRGGYWWGPDSWRTTGPEWTYEYYFWPQGILKSPELYTGGSEE